ncbi:hypothetical protein C7B62_18590 [Pleurocapsa sp. CCALA 161]|nr:hypothetical protein C7B62_18590 [Pleurocapsa sp. CCALA 161]
MNATSAHLNSLAISLLVVSKLMWQSISIFLYNGLLWEIESKKKEPDNLVLCCRELPDTNPIG